MKKSDLDKHYVLLMEAILNGYNLLHNIQKAQQKIK